MATPILDLPDLGDSFYSIERYVVGRAGRVPDNCRINGSLKAEASYALETAHRNGAPLIGKVNGRRSKFFVTELASNVPFPTTKPQFLRWKMRATFLIWADEQQA